MRYINTAHGPAACTVITDDKTLLWVTDIRQWIRSDRWTFYKFCSRSALYKTIFIEIVTAGFIFLGHLSRPRPTSWYTWAAAASPGSTETASHGIFIRYFGQYPSLYFTLCLNSRATFLSIVMRRWQVEYRSLRLYRELWSRVRRPRGASGDNGDLRQRPSK